MIEGLKAWGSTERPRRAIENPPVLENGCNDYVRAEVQDDGFLVKGARAHPL